MNRRDFLKRLTVGATAVVIAANIPISWVPAHLRSRVALDHLTTAYNAASKGVGVRNIPRQIFVSPELYKQIESEMLATERFCETVSAPTVPTLKFKIATMYAKPYMRGWDIAFGYEPYPTGESRNAGEPL